MNSKTLIISGTDTDVGKTVTTAAIAALAIAQGKRVAVLKPAQTGVCKDEAGDLACIEKLVGSHITLRELARYPDPLSPEAAARRRQGAVVTAQQIAQKVKALQQDCDLVLIEGAGGLLVRFNSEGETIADVAAHLNAPIVCVVKAGLGTLNATALTAEAAAARGLKLEGLVIGKWPKKPDLAAQENLIDLPIVAQAPIIGALPEGIGKLSKDEFLTIAENSLSAQLGGSFEL